MTCQDLASYLLDESGFQIAKVFENLPEDSWDLQLTPSSLSPRQTLEHLCEVYEAFLALSEGREHQWGSFTVEDRSVLGLKSLAAELRSRAVVKALATDNPDVIKAAVDYVAQHDAYHVGQIAALRIAHEPSWDPYSIYPS